MRLFLSARFCLVFMRAFLFSEAVVNPLAKKITAYLEEIQTHSTGRLSEVCSRQPGFFEQTTQKLRDLLGNLRNGVSLETAYK